MPSGKLVVLETGCLGKSVRSLCKDCSYPLCPLCLLSHSTAVSRSQQPCHSLDAMSLNLLSQTTWSTAFRFSFTQSFRSLADVVGWFTNELHDWSLKNHFSPLNPHEPSLYCVSLGLTNPHQNILTHITSFWVFPSPQLQTLPHPPRKQFKSL